MLYAVVLVLMVTSGHAAVHENTDLSSDLNSLSKRIEPVDTIDGYFRTLAYNIKAVVGALPFGGFGLNSSIDRLMDAMVEWGDQAAGTVNSVANTGLVQVSKFIIIGVDFVDGYAKIFQDALKEFEPKEVEQLLNSSQLQVGQFLEQLLNATDQLRKNAVSALIASGIDVDNLMNGGTTSQRPRTNTRTPRPTRAAN